MMKRLDSEKDEGARGYLAVGLGLMNAREAVTKINSIVDDSKYRPDLLKQAAIALGLLGDKELVPKLITLLQESKGLATQASLSSALGFIGDQRSIDPLVLMLQNESLTERARGFAAVALGIVADKELLPWNSKIGLDLNYRASTETLTNQSSGTGILDIL
jgi:HEAT repeat protein